MIRKIAILTSGGDSPGMNNTIRAIVKNANLQNIETFFVFEGYKGLCDGNIKSSKTFDVDSYISVGGTFIYSSRFPEFKNKEYRLIAKKNLSKIGIDTLIVIGGDGSYKGAQLLHELGVKTIALPGTIDNDVTSSDYTIGYSTALNTIVNSVDKIRDTILSHDRVAIVEVMGRHCGDLALFGGIASGAEIIITNENKKTPEEIGNIVKIQKEKGKRGIVVIISENVYNDVPNLAKVVEKVSGLVTRTAFLSLLQRGGRPTSEDRILSMLMGIKAIELILSNKSGLAIGIVDNKLQTTPITEALNLSRKNLKKLLVQINKINQN